jgi:hypothetical protein
VTLKFGRESVGCSKRQGICHASRIIQDDVAGERRMGQLMDVTADAGVHLGSVTLANTYSKEEDTRVCPEICIRIFWTKNEFALQ